MNEVRREFYQKMVDDWANRLSECKARGDETAIKIAAKELSTYQMMLERLELE